MMLRPSSTGKRPEDGVPSDRDYPSSHTTHLPERRWTSSRTSDNKRRDIQVPFSVSLLGRSLKRTSGDPVVSCSRSADVGTSQGGSSFPSSTFTWSDREATGTYTPHRTTCVKKQQQINLFIDQRTVCGSVPNECQPNLRRLEPRYPLIVPSSYLNSETLGLDPSLSERTSLTFPPRDFWGSSSSTQNSFVALQRSGPSYFVPLGPSFSSNLFPRLCTSRVFGHTHLYPNLTEYRCEGLVSRLLTQEYSSEWII